MGHRREDSLSLEGEGISPPHSSAWALAGVWQGSRSEGECGDRGPQALRSRLANSRTPVSWIAVPVRLLPVKSMGFG